MSFVTHFATITNDLYISYCCDYEQAFEACVATGTNEMLVLELIRFSRVFSEAILINIIFG